MIATPALLLAQAAPAGGANPLLQVLVFGFLLVNALVIAVAVWQKFPAHSPMQVWKKRAGYFLVYEILAIGAIVMLLPFYWMVVTSFKDGETSSAFPPVWSPSRMKSYTADPQTGNEVPVVRLETAREAGQLIDVVPEDQYTFQAIEDDGIRVTRQVPEEGAVFEVDPATLRSQMQWDLDLANYLAAWYRPEQSTRGQVNFLTYFIVSIVTASVATGGALATSALAAFAFARLHFWGKTVLFYIILATMMVPGQVLLIPNFLILSTLGMLDTYAALTVPWLASVFTIFLMRQFFMTIPEDLWDAARIDGASRFRYLWQIVVPLSKPVFITAGIFDFLNNWNSLLWPLIVTSTPNKRTLMVGLQNLSDDAGTEFHILMAASCLAVLPIVVAFFFLQRFFIEGIARTGLK